MVITVVSKLREVRERQNKSISQISRDTGIARSSIQQYERIEGDHPRLDNAFLLAHYLNVRLDELFVPVVDQRRAS